MITKDNKPSFNQFTNALKLYQADAGSTIEPVSLFDITFQTAYTVIPTMYNIVQFVEETQTRWYVVDKVEYVQATQVIRVHAKLDGYLSFLVQFFDETNTSQYTLPVFFEQKHLNRYYYDSSTTYPSGNYYVDFKKQFYLNNKHELTIHKYKKINYNLNPNDYQYLDYAEVIAGNLLSNGTSTPSEVCAYAYCLIKMSTNESNQPETTLPLYYGFLPVESQFSPAASKGFRANNLFIGEITNGWGGGNIQYSEMTQGLRGVLWYEIIKYIPQEELFDIVPFPIPLELGFAYPFNPQKIEANVAGVLKPNAKYTTVDHIFVTSPGMNGYTYNGYDFNQGLNDFWMDHEPINSLDDFVDETQQVLSSLLPLGTVQLVSLNSLPEFTDTSWVSEAESKWTYQMTPPQTVQALTGYVSAFRFDKYGIDTSVQMGYMWQSLNSSTLGDYAPNAVDPGAPQGFVDRAIFTLPHTGNLYFYNFGANQLAWGQWGSTNAVVTELSNLFTDPYLYNYVAFRLRCQGQDSFIDLTGFTQFNDWSYFFSFVLNMNHPLSTMTNISYLEFLQPNTIPTSKQWTNAYQGDQTVYTTPIPWNYNGVNDTVFMINLKDVMSSLSSNWTNYLATNLNYYHMGKNIAEINLQQAQLGLVDSIFSLGGAFGHTAINTGSTGAQNEWQLLTADSPEEAGYRAVMGDFGMGGAVLGGIEAGIGAASGIANSVFNLKKAKLEYDYELYGKKQDYSRVGNLRAASGNNVYSLFDASAVWTLEEPVEYEMKAIVAYYNAYGFILKKWVPFEYWYNRTNYNFVKITNFSDVYLNDLIEPYKNLCDEILGAGLRIWSYTGEVLNQLDFTTYYNATNVEAFQNNNEVEYLNTFKK